MEISIGILAHNEASVIHKTLASLFQQSLLNTSNIERKIEVIVVPNGCTDATATIAKSSLEELSSACENSQIHWKVCELDQAGKSNAWNYYVHQFSNPDATYLFLMDADIYFVETETLLLMIETLESQSDAWISVDNPIKDIALKENKSLIEKLSILVSQLSNNPALEGKPAWLCGQLYCAKAEKLRQLYLPEKLSAQDSFLYTLITTDGLQTKLNPQRIIRAKSASHIFEAYTQINRLFRHEKWLIMSSAINELIYEEIKNSNPFQKSIGIYIKELNYLDENWLEKYIQTAKQQKSWWLIPSSILSRRFQSLKNKSFYKQLLLLPIAIGAFLIDFLLSFQANLELHQNHQVQYWGK